MRQGKRKSTAMQTGLEITELARRITAQKQLKHDLIADTREMEMLMSDEAKPTFSIGVRGDNGGTFPIMPLAHEQIGARLDIPRRYYQRMQAEAPELLTNNVNLWLHKSEERRMLRTMGGDLRAFLSNRYQRIENEEIAEVALPILLRMPDCQIVSCEVTDRRLYIQAVMPRIIGEVKLNDVVQAGVAISNSEVGLGAASVSALIWRLRCLNGMVCQDGGMRAYHVGRRIDSNEELWADDTKKADDRAVLLKVRDMVSAAVDEAQFRRRIEKMKALTEGKVTGSPTAAVEILAKKVDANESEKNGILRALIEGGDLSAWGLLNAITAQAHDKAISYDRAVEFETAGGALLDLPKGEWRQILEAE